MTRDEITGEEQHIRTFRRHTIDVHREFGKRWYIIVTAPSGMRAYDGWWQGSENKTAAEAIEEAKRGACLMKAVGP